MRPNKNKEFALKRNKKSHFLKVDSNKEESTTANEKLWQWQNPMVGE